MFKWEKETFNYVNNENIFNLLKQYVNLVLEKNKEFNLTGFDEEKIWIDGIYQSIVLLDKFIKEEEVDLLDIGAGAGFPSIPFFIFKKNNIKLTIFEPMKKRCDFLNLVKQKLNLKNLIILNKRVEEEKEMKFNYITARAVMPLKMLIEASSSCGIVGAKYIFLKSKEAQNELEESKWICKKLKIEDIDIFNINLNDDKTHNIIFYTKKYKNISSFPRPWNEIKKDKRNYE